MSASATTTNCYYWFPKTLYATKPSELQWQLLWLQHFNKHFERLYRYSRKALHENQSIYLRQSVSGETIFSNLLFELEPHFLVCLFIFKWSLLLWTHSEKQPFFLACSLDLGHYFKFLSLRFCFKQLLSYIFTTLSTSPPGNLISLCSKIGVCCMQPTDC